MAQINIFYWIYLLKFLIITFCNSNCTHSHFACIRCVNVIVSSTLQIIQFSYVCSKIILTISCKKSIWSKKCSSEMKITTVTENICLIHRKKKLVLTYSRVEKKSDFFAEKNFKRFHNKWLVNLFRLLGARRGALPFCFTIHFAKSLWHEILMAAATACIENQKCH